MEYLDYHENYLYNHKQVASLRTKRQNERCGSVFVVVGREVINNETQLLHKHRSLGCTIQEQL